MNKYLKEMREKQMQITGVRVVADRGRTCTKEILF